MAMTESRSSGLYTFLEWIKKNVSANELESKFSGIFKIPLLNRIKCYFKDQS